MKKRYYTLNELLIVFSAILCIVFAIVFAGAIGYTVFHFVEKVW